jgi:two-component system cell cycle response regulator
MSGVEVAQELKRDPRLKDIPLVAVTALAMLGDGDKLLHAGFDGYIAKPVDAEKFTDQIDAFLPQAKRSTVKISESPPGGAVEKAPRNGLTILAVDNVQASLDFTSSMLEHMGYTVLTATAMNEALSLARESVPDLIVSDVCMPGPGGFELIEEIKKDPRLKSIPFMFITSTAIDVAARQKGLALGAAKYLFRPIEPGQLLAEIEGCLDEMRRR